MKEFTLISYQNGKCGFKDDDWQIIRRITTTNDLYEALKEGYLQDAAQRNNYPVCSLEIERRYIKKELLDEGTYFLGYLEDDSEIIDYRFTKTDEDLDLSEYEESFIKFEKWKNKIKNLIPVLQKNKREEAKCMADFRKLTKLARIFGYDLVKKESENV